jgi:hypothetical protein
MINPSAAGKQISITSKQALNRVSSCKRLNRLFLRKNENITMIKFSKGRELERIAHSFRSKNENKTMIKFSEGRELERIAHSFRSKNENKTMIKFSEGRELERGAQPLSKPKLVLGARLELARGCPRGILSPLCLPIPPPELLGRGKICE